jgi:hypothetical protein
LPAIIATQHRALAADNLVTSLSAFVDDISFSISSQRADTTLDAAVATFRVLREELSRVGLPIAADKTEAIASTDALHRDFATIIVIANSAANTCKKLGVYFCLSAAR